MILIFNPTDLQGEISSISANTHGRLLWKERLWPSLWLKNCIWRDANLFERLIPETGTEMKKWSKKTQDEDTVHHVSSDGIQKFYF